MPAKAYNQYVSEQWEQQNTKNANTFEPFDTIEDSNHSHILCSAFCIEIFKILPTKCKELAHTHFILAFDIRQYIYINQSNKILLIISIYPQVAKHSIKKIIKIKSSKVTTTTPRSIIQTFKSTTENQ